MNNQDNPSHEEVWDDSALIDSWNEALAEYKKYHSIHAKGGSLRDLEPKRTEPKVKAEPASERSDKQLDDVEDGEEVEIPLTGPSDDQTPATAHQEPQTTQRPAGPPLVFPPQAVLGSLQDENLKKLLMSWYYAGYYTGLFEGQQQAQHSRES